MRSYGKEYSTPSVCIAQACGQLCQLTTIAADDTPQHEQVFQDIATYHLAHTVTSQSNGSTQHRDEQATKKRKLENGALPIGRTQAGQPRQIILEEIGRAHV